MSDLATMLHLILRSGWMVNFERLADSRVKCSIRDRLDRAGADVCRSYRGEAYGVEDALNNALTLMLTHPPRNGYTFDDACGLFPHEEGEPMPEEMVRKQRGG